LSDFSSFGWSIFSGEGHGCDDSNLFWSTFQGAGQLFRHGVTDLGQFATKTLAHGVSSGLQNMIQGGDFGSGFMSGSIGHITGYAGGMIGGDVGGILGSGMGGGISSALSGGDFGRGFQSGAMQYMFNRMGEGLVNAGVEMVENGLRSLGEMAQNVPDPVYDVASVAGSIAEVAAYGTFAAPFVGAANLAINGAGVYRTYNQYGVSWRTAGAIGVAALPVKGLSPVYRPIANYGKNAASLIYGNMIK